MSGIADLLNYSCQVLRRDTMTDDPLTNDEYNHPPETGWTVVATVACAVQERSMKEQASLVDIGEVRSTHKVYTLPSAEIDESRVLRVNGLDLRVVGVRDGGGRGHHLEIDAVEYTGDAVISPVGS